MPIQKPSKINELTSSLKSVKMMVLLVVGLLTVALVGLTGYQLWLHDKEGRYASQGASLNEARTLSQNGSCEQAIGGLEDLLKQKISDKGKEAEGRLLLGECQLKAKDFDKAINELEKAHALYGELKDSTAQLKAELLLKMAKIERDNKTMLRPAEDGSSDNENENGTYDGVHFN